MIAGILREGGSFRLKRALWRVCLCSCVLLPASLGWTDEAPADQVHLFRSFPADRNRVYQGSPGSGGGHPLVCRLDNGEVLAVFQAWDADSDWKTFPLCGGRALEPAVIFPSSLPVRPSRESQP